MEEGLIDTRWTLSRCCLLIETPFSTPLKCRITFWVRVDFVSIHSSCFSKVVLVMWIKHSLEYSTQSRQMWKLGQDKEVRCTLIRMGSRGPIPKDTTIDILLLLMCSNLSPNQCWKHAQSWEWKYRMTALTRSLILLMNA